jgi:hypothetical protein
MDWLASRLTIVGGVRETPVGARRERRLLFCARAALETPERGPSTWPLGAPP